MLYDIGMLDNVTIRQQGGLVVKILGGCTGRPGFDENQTFLNNPSWMLYEEILNWQSLVLMCMLSKQNIPKMAKSVTYHRLFSIHISTLMTGKNLP